MPTINFDQKTAHKLAKIAGLLGSDYEGERASAALKATQILRNVGITWGGLIMAAVPAPEEKMPELGTWRETCRACLASGQWLRDWERNFLETLPKFRRLSVKQRYVLDEIARRVGVKEPRS